MTLADVRDGIAVCYDVADNDWRVITKGVSGDMGPDQEMVMGDVGMSYAKTGKCNL